MFSVHIDRLMICKNCFMLGGDQPTTKKINFGKTNIEDIRVYRRRWFILALFSLSHMCNSFHWIQYSIITDVIAEFYCVPPVYVDWLSIIYMVVHLLLVLPAAYILDKKGLRVTVLIGITGTALGGWIKVLSVRRDLFYVTFIGQTVCAAAYCFLFSVPTRLASAWFGEDQRARACSIGVLLGELGVALGFLVPPWLVSTTSNTLGIETDLRILFYCGSILPTILFVLVLFFFQKEPPLPPSTSTALIAENQDGGQEHSFMKSVQYLLRNRNYVLLVFAFSVSNAVMDGISTLLSQFMQSRFPEHEEDAGRLGVISILTGIVGSFFIGLLLDKTHRFKLSAVVLYVVKIAAMTLFALSVYFGSLTCLYIAMGFLGLFAYSFYSLTYEFAAELTYPVPEGTSTSIINACMFFMASIFTAIAGWILRTFSELSANIFFLSVLVIGFVFTIFVQEKLERITAQNNAPGAKEKSQSA